MDDGMPSFVAHDILPSSVVSPADLTSKPGCTRQQFCTQDDQSASYESNFSFAESSAPSSLAYSVAHIQTFFSDEGEEEALCEDFAASFSEPTYDPPSLHDVIASWPIPHEIDVATGLHEGFSNPSCSEIQPQLDPLLIPHQIMAPRLSPKTNSNLLLPSLMPCKKILSRGRVIAYGSGHMLNDIAAACWFTYLLIYCTDVGLSPQQAAAVLMSGQLADAAATLVAGHMIDSFGHFKMWHLGGTLVASVCFFGVFGVCVTCWLPSASTAFQTLVYSVFAALFNCGWAATQVSHMSLANCITANSTSRVALNSCRNAFTMVANLSLYAIAFSAFHWLPDSTPAQVHMQFRWIAVASLLTGGVFLLLFYAGVKEPRFLRSAGGSHCQPSLMRSCAFWFSQAAYFQVAGIYVAVRLITNVSQAMLPFFLVYDLNLPATAKASVPALIFTCSFIISIVLQELRWSVRRMKVAYAIGSALWVAASLAFLYITPASPSFVYPLALVVGAANALILVTATSLEGVLVGHNYSGCAFVYGSLSFMDKLACGVALVIIEAVNGKHEYCGVPGSSCPRSLVRWVLFGLPLVSSLLATAILYCTEFHESPPSSPVVRQVKEGSLTSPLLSTQALLDAQPHVDTMGDDLWLSEAVHRGRRTADDD